jgi:large repetitive protein
MVDSAGGPKGVQVGNFMILVACLWSAQAQAADGDGDGYDSSVDCNDYRAAIHPGANETCNYQDDDCDGTIDAGLKIAAWWDNDQDGYGPLWNAIQFMACPHEIGGSIADAGGDCDDYDASANPGETEVCDFRDNDCDLVADEGLMVPVWTDEDDDNFGTGNPFPACPNHIASSTWYTDVNGDCDDHDAAVHPGASEVCNDTDDDCDGTEDEGNALTVFGDVDADGHGDELQPYHFTCDFDIDEYNEGVDSGSGAGAGTGHVAPDADDCDDDDPVVYLDAYEYCDNLDNDCDAEVDEEGEGPVAVHWDYDVDGYGGNYAFDTCAGFVSDYNTSNPSYPITTDASDCDDYDAYRNPGAGEICADGFDQNCDGIDPQDENEGVCSW